MYRGYSLDEEYSPQEPCSQVLQFVSVVRRAAEDAAFCFGWQAGPLE